MTIDVTDPDANNRQVNSAELNQVQANYYGSAPCEGVTLADLRQRLRNELSGYAQNTLISSDPVNDVERQFINDGISVLWPHDYQIVNVSIKTEPNKDKRFILPDDCEHVFSVFRADQDINNNSVNLTALPHHDMWAFDRSYIKALTPVMLDGQPWLDRSYKAIWVEPSCYKYPWIIARYARKWQPLTDELACIDPSPNRVNAVVFYACYQYFASQMQVSTESVRYRNYQSISQQFFQYYQQLLVKDSKPLYIL